MQAQTHPPGFVEALTATGAPWKKIKELQSREQQEAASRFSCGDHSAFASPSFHGAVSFTLRPSLFTSSCDVPRCLPMKRVCRRRCKEPEHEQDVRLSSQSSGRKLFHVKQDLLHSIAPTVPDSFVLAASVSCSRQQYAEGICQPKIFQRTSPGPCDA